jgi:hypothetical protein
MGRSDLPLQTEEIMQPSTSSLFKSVSPSPQQAASSGSNTPGFRTIAFSLLVDRALSA